MILTSPNPRFVIPSLQLHEFIFQHIAKAKISSLTELRSAERILLRFTYGQGNKDLFDNTTVEFGPTARSPRIPLLIG